MQLLNFGDEFDLESQKRLEDRSALMQFSEIVLDLLDLERFPSRGLFSLQIFCRNDLEYGTDLHYIRLGLCLWHLTLCCSLSLAR